MLRFPAPPLASVCGATAREKLDERDNRAKAWRKKDVPKRCFVDVPVSPDPPSISMATARYVSQSMCRSALHKAVLHIGNRKQK